MEKKRTTIPYKRIIGLVIGIIALEFAAYVYGANRKGPPEISYEDCRSRMAQWCAICRLQGWTGGKSLEDFIDKDCFNLLNSRRGVTAHANCTDSSADAVKTDCRKIGFIEE